MCGRSEDRIHPFEITEDVAAAPVDVGLAAGDAGKGLKDTERRLGVAHAVPRASRRLVLDCWLAQESYGSYQPAAAPAAPGLAARAGETLALLLLVVVVASLGLAPQSGRALAAEVIACAGAPAAVVLAVQLRHGPDNPADPIWWYLTRIATIQIPALLFLTGGITLAVRHGGGLYWMLPATLTAFTGAVYTAWVLLVEIIRHNRR